ncbi:MAG: IS1182 family transposase [Desulfobacterales bacterium]
MALKLPKRHQGILFPPSIDAMVGQDAPVRAYDAMIDTMVMSELGIVVDHNKAGCPEYDPRSMLKLLVFGYSYNIRGSRKLERATHDNISFIWLMGGLKPSYKTISEFRRLNKKALKKVIKQCAHMCVDLDLIAGNVLFVDGTKIRANASISNSYTKEKAQKVLANIEKRIDKLIASCEQVDADEEGQPSFARLSKGLENARKLKSKIESIAEKLKSKDAPSSINTVDPDCCRTHGRQGSHAGFNGQVVVDEKNGLIVNSDVVSENNDLGQLSSQIEQANEVVGGKCETACGDAGYCNYDKMNELVEKGIEVIVPSKQQAREDDTDESTVKEFDKSRFTYDKENDVYICPENKILSPQGSHNIKKCHYYAAGTQCRKCRHFGMCTTSKRVGRRVARYFNEEFRDRMAMHYDKPSSKETYRKRKQYAELPFGHIKRNLNAGHFLLRGLDGVRAEMSLLSTCFNMARLINIFGVSALTAKLKAL